MDQQTLQTFISVAKHGSFTRASEHLHLTQPAISKRIATLESELNSQLFDRIGKEVGLTASGELFLTHANSILEAYDNCKTQLDNLNTTVSGTLNVGVSHHIGLHRLPSVLKRYASEHPRVNLNIQFLDSEEAYGAVLNGEIEFALATLALEQSSRNKVKLKEELIWADPLCFNVNKKHPLTLLAKNKALQLQDLLAFPAILPKTNTITGQIINQQFEKKKLKLEQTIETNYLETIKMMTTINLGWSVLPKGMVNESLTPLDIENNFMSRQLGLITHKERILSNASQAFIEMLPNL